MLSWGEKRKTVYSLVLILVVFIAVGIFLVSKIPKPNCFDGKINQTETGIDCGGTCTPCLGEVKELTVLWARPFRVADGRFDAAVLMENSNQVAGIVDFKYSLKLYDSNNILVAVKEGTTFVNPDEQFVIFYPNIETGTRNPTKVFVEFEKNQNWFYVNKEKAPLLIENKNFNNLPTPVLEAVLRNKDMFEVKDIEVVGVIFDKDGNALGASRTKIDEMQGDGKKSINFTWPEPFSQEFVSSKVYTRTDLTK